MYEIRKINEINMSDIKSFLSNVPSIKEVDEVILSSASILYEDNEIAGAIAFEKFHQYALIRYFIFKRHVDSMVIKELFESLEKTAQIERMKYIFSVVTTSDIEDLFKSLSFSEIDKNRIYVDEEKFVNSKFKDTKMMMKEII